MHQIAERHQVRQARRRARWPPARWAPRDRDRRARSNPFGGGSSGLALGGSGAVGRGACCRRAGLQLHPVHLAPHVHPVDAGAVPVPHRHDDHVAPRVVDGRPRSAAWRWRRCGTTGAVPGVDPAQAGYGSCRPSPRWAKCATTVSPRIQSRSFAGRVHGPAQPRRAEAADLLELLGRGVERERIGPHGVCRRGGARAGSSPQARVCSSFRLFRSSADRVGDQVPVRAHGVPVALAPPRRSAPAARA